MWTDEQIKELAKKHGWWAVESWWQQAIPRFRAMLEEYAAQQCVHADEKPADIQAEIDELSEKLAENHTRLTSAFRR